MNPNATFERDLARWLEAEAPATGPAGLHEAVIERASTMRQRPAWLAALRDGTFPSPVGVARRPAGRMTYAFIVLGLILALIVGVLVAGAFRSQPYRAPSWVATGSMVTPRTGHTATLLRDGRVLVAGGSLGDPAMGFATFSSAELYDPASRTWAATGSMGQRRSGGMATLLRDARVLVAGGNGTSAELYDPTSGTWTATGDMVTAVYGYTAILLRDGRVLVAGDGTSAELYDPASGTWTATGSMVTPHGWGHTATLLRDGRVLVAGGNGASEPLASAELYDPASGTWTATGDMVTPRGETHTATLLPDGTVLVAGGGGGASSGCCALPSPELPSAELYDPVSGTWAATGNMNEIRSYDTATLLPNGKVLVAGGNTGSNSVEPQASAELYDPATRSWTTTSTLIEAHSYGETATLLADGTVLLVGGSNGIFGTSADPGMAGAELYDPGIGVAPTESASATPPSMETPVATPSPSSPVIASAGPGWTASVTMATPRLNPTVTLLLDGLVLVAGGNGASEPLASADLYDPGSGTWSATGSLVAHAGGGFTATLLRDGKVLVAGGTRDVPARDGSGNGITEALGSAELYDPASGTWTATGSMVTPRYASTATLLSDGRVLVAGGSSATDALAAAELYDPGTGTWSATGSMLTTRFGHTATLLPGGKVLVAGGVVRPVTASAELYDPGSGTWTATGSMARPRVGHTATLLPDGRVLVVVGNGGISGFEPLTSAELYDPDSGTWTATGNMALPRDSHTATLLLNGKVLVAGGQDFRVMPGGELGRVASLASAELYDPVSETWTATGDMGTPRQGHTAILLPDGKVLVFGGANSHDGFIESLDSMELYDPSAGT
jgi:N-acetylneuraminic acid mutarotase